MTHKSLNPDRYSAKMLDSDTNSMNPDPQIWPEFVEIFLPPGSWAWKTLGWARLYSLTELWFLGSMAETTGSREEEHVRFKRSQLMPIQRHNERAPKPIQQISLGWPLLGEFDLFYHAQSRVPCL
jgi:hypothetical protein